VSQTEKQEQCVLLLTGDVAAILGLSSQSVRLMARYGGLPPAAVTPGGVRLFDPESVLRLRAERERGNQR